MDLSWAVELGCSDLLTTVKTEDKDGPLVRVLGVAREPPTADVEGDRPVRERDRRRRVGVERARHVLPRPLPPQIRHITFSS